VSADSIVPGADALAIGSGGTGGGPANPQNLNRYSYVDNNPVKNTDPSGHVCLVFCLLGAAGGTLVEPVGGTIVGGVGGSLVDDAILAGAAALGLGGLAAAVASTAHTTYTTDEMGNPIAPVADSLAGAPAAPDAGPTSAEGAEASSDIPAIPDQPAGKLCRMPDSLVKRDGIDAHAVKKATVGEPVSHYDLHRDDNEHVWVKAKGKNVPDSDAVWAGGTREQLAEDYPIRRGRR
jgi:hypothetical protein